MAMDGLYAGLCRWLTLRTRAEALPAPLWFGLGVGCVALFFTACSWITSPNFGGGTSSSEPSNATADASFESPSASTPGAYTQQRVESEPDIRVRIVERAERVQIAGPRQAAVSVEQSGIAPINLPTPLIVTAADDDWMVRDAGGVVHQFPRVTHKPVDALAVDFPDGAAGTMFSVDSKVLPGVIRLSGRRDISPGIFDVIEYVPLESYLPGVIAKELYKDWALETFKAQAIAARSYALQERGRRMALGVAFDVESNEADQAYGGRTDHAIAHRAVKDTAGVVLTYQGRFLRAYYCSTVGGRAANARDTWPTGKGFEFNLDAPIQASSRDDADSASPLYRWTVARDRKELIKRIREYGRTANSAVRNMDSVAKIEVLERNEFGRPKAFKLYQDDGRWYKLNAEEIRLACNQPVSGLPAITKASRISSGDFEVRRESTSKGDAMVFDGRGFGHGVGMSQYGAQGMAMRGRQARDILMHYYPGATIERAY
jgi:stage II sporulation protein D